MKEIILLTDYNNEFLIQLDHNGEYTSMDLNSLSDAFKRYGYTLHIMKFQDLNTYTDYKGKYVLYQTSEANGQFYKKYIEDILYILKNSGALLLPKYEYLKAHHNKGFMELIRSNFNDRDLKSVKSIYFGSARDALCYAPDLPVVIKKISGSGSEGVYLANNYKKYKYYINKASKTLVYDSLIELIKSYIKNGIKVILSCFLKGKYKINSTTVERPVVVQNLIRSLSGDYKVLYFGGKYYTLYRKNRKNDFRASGSGKFFEVPEEEHEGLLNFARKLILEIDFPIIGMDIGFDGIKYHLIEFQMIHIGPYTLQASNFWHEQIDGKWMKFIGKSDLNEEFARSIHEYIKDR